MLGCQVSGDCVAYGTLIDLYASTGSLEQVTTLSLFPFPSLYSLPFSSPVPTHHARFAWPLC